MIEFAHFKYTVVFVACRKMVSFPFSIVDAGNMFYCVVEVVRNQSDVL